MTNYSDFYRNGPYSEVHQTHMSVGGNGARLFLVKDRPAGAYEEPPMDNITLQLCVRGRSQVVLDLGAGPFRGNGRSGHWVVAPAGRRCRYELADAIDLLVLEIPQVQFDEFGEQKKFHLESRHRRLSDDAAVFQLAQALFGECRRPSGMGSLWCDHAVATIAGMLCLGSTPGPAPPARGGLAPWQLRRACESMTAQLDGDPGLDALAAIVGCSPTHFSRAFKQSTGVAPFHWLAERRIEKAKEMLEENRLSLAEIALAVGFSAQPQFTTAFGRATGMTPGAWRRARGP